jgi:hypothetical protein
MINVLGECIDEKILYGEKLSKLAGKLSVDINLCISDSDVNVRKIALNVFAKI